MGVGVERWRRMAIELRMVGLVSSSRAQNDDDQSAPEFPAKPDLQPDRLCEHRQMSSASAGHADAARPLPESGLLYYTGEMTMKEIGGILGINESRVSQIHKIALEKMGIALQAAGIHSTAALV